jgi:hypothetical protein
MRLHFDLFTELFQLISDRLLTHIEPPCWNGPFTLENAKRPASPSLESSGNAGRLCLECASAGFAAYSAKRVRVDRVLPARDQPVFYT